LQSATTLVQFPTGLVAAALSFAVLPPLTAAANAGDTAGFKRTLALGFRLGLLLMTPAMVGLIALRTPVVALLFQHGACHTGCTYMNALALQNYAYQLPFLALDQLLIAAFYARKNTIVPVVVGVVAIGLWALVAVPFTPTIGMPALAFANTTLNSGHAVILFVLLTITIGNLGLRELWAGLWRIALASVAMGGVIWGLLALLPLWAPTIFTLDSLRGQALTVVAAGLPATLIYFALVSLLGVQEIRMLGGIIRARLGGRRG
jgi:putative peptidoglycan lipid II flippase